MIGGLYVLFVRITGEDQLLLDIGALGTCRFDPGLYAYVGSANGPGGFARIDRHRASAAGDTETRHWHIDYLLASPRSELASVTELPHQTDECGLAATIPGSAVPRFGASDCDCRAHLFAVPDREKVDIAINRFQRTSGR